jgi:hypothetical protein
VTEDEAPKTAYEIILERLKRKDQEAGVEQRPPSNEQRSRIAELRRVYEARLAEREILHQAALRRTGGDPEAVEQLEQEYRRDRERIVSERDRKIEEERTSAT